MILYLTTPERALYDKLPEALRKEFEAVTEAVMEEKGTAFETSEQLLARADVLTDEETMMLKTVCEMLGKGLSAGTPIGNIDLGNVPVSMMSTVCFLLGATGLTRFIGTLLENAKSLDMIRSAMELSHIRHSILANNAVFLTSSPVYGIVKN